MSTTRSNYEPGHNDLDRTFGTFATRICGGECAYPVDGEETIAIPNHAIRGRAPPLGKNFSGMLDLRTGLMCIGCFEEAPFWLEIDMSQIPGLTAAPGGSAALQAQEAFEAAQEE